MPTLPPRHPLDDSLIARLHLHQDDRLKLSLIRAGMHSVDTVSRLTLGKPFFALRETEALLRNLDGKTGPDLFQSLFDLQGGTRIKPHGVQNVPKSGPVIIASPHPTGMLDFLAHAQALKTCRADLKVVASQDTEKFLGPDTIVPVQIDKKNRATSASATHKAMQKHLKGGGALHIFGSGRVPYRTQGKLVEPNWRNGATRISALCDAQIIPAALDAQNSRYYYNLRKFSRYLSRRDDNFGAMVGSLRYAAELLEKLGGTYDIHYGKPQPPGTPAADLKTSAEALVCGLYKQI